ncbi:Achaete-scute transcription factor-related protein [Dioscorea alata]|uniref:Achaete-scute transcription factor-related protein n=1 Tax=Dioscorea alata TaxID=55571 RepID=A0ACB7UET6_DIOAL|nr:Achaete-scute transcription factor-related protein [Dioscorea alata]
MKSATEGPKMERKTVEKNRRLHMKRLCSQLSSFIPKDDFHNSKEVLTQPDHLEQAAKYIKELKERIEKLKEKRRGMMMNNEGMDIGCNLPVIEVRHLDSTLEVLLISGIHSKSFMFHEVISLLEEEGAEVLNANYSVVGDKIFHTIHSQAVSSRIGFDTTRVSERLRQLVR